MTRRHRSARPGVRDGHPVAVMWWAVAGLVGWCASAPLVAVATGRVLRRRTPGVAVEDLLRVPEAWAADRLDPAGA